MKTKYLFLLVFVVFLFQNTLQAQTTNAGSKSSKPGPKIKSAVFSGIWKGAEKCNVTGAPVAILTIFSNGPSSVLISGIYSISGRIKGSIKGHQVIIELQEVQDPNFQNLAISGSLMLSDDRKSLVASFSIQNNNTRDECTATYQKAPL